MMPKGFSDEQRERIERRLLEAGREQFGRFGLRKANVAELARAAGIAKGSFYLFFPSKEALFWAVLEELEEESHALLDRALEAGGLEHPRTFFAGFLRQQLEMLESHPVLRVLADREELEALMHKLPPETLERHLRADVESMRRAAARMQTAGVRFRRDPALLMGVAKGMFFWWLNRDLIGAPDFSELTDFVIEATCAALFEETAAGGEGEP